MSEKQLCRPQDWWRREGRRCSRHGSREAKPQQPVSPGF